MTYEVHPVADLFPMLADDELAELAADIKQRGLLQPIVLDTDGRILDGRNRLAACEWAGVEPTFETFSGEDPSGYALAVNVQRRNLTKGQRAMLIVESGLSTEYTGADDGSKISKQYLSRARIVKQYAPALVGAVISGADQLNRAYEFAQSEKAKSEGAEAQLARLRAEDPELASKVIEGELTLPGAWAERRERAKQEAVDRETGRTAAGRLAADLKTAVSSIAIAAQLGETGLVTPSMVDDCRAAADLLERILKEDE